MKYRKIATDYMLHNPDDFVPFLTERIETYCKRMAKNGEWGGHMELLALSRALNANIVVHQFMMPRFELAYPNPDKNTRTLHVAYLDGQHYTSIRTLEGDNHVGLKLMSHLKAVAEHGKQSSKDRSISQLEKNVLIVMQQTGFKDEKFIRETLDSVLGDLDSAIQIVLAEQYTREEEEARAQEEKMREADEEDAEESKATESKLDVETKSNSVSKPSGHLRPNEALFSYCADDDEKFTVPEYKLDDATPEDNVTLANSRGTPLPSDQTQDKANSNPASKVQGKATQGETIEVTQSACSSAGGSASKSKPNKPPVLSAKEKRRLKQLAKQEKELEKAAKRAELRKLAAESGSGHKGKGGRGSADDSDSDDVSLINDALGAISI